MVVAGENEKNPDAQAKADAGHQKQARRVGEITGREVSQWKPKSEQGKDLADMNQKIATLSPPATPPRRGRAEGTGGVGRSDAFIAGKIWGQTQRGWIGVFFG